MPSCRLGNVGSRPEVFRTCPSSATANSRPRWRRCIPRRCSPPWSGYPSSDAKIINQLSAGDILTTLINYNKFTKILTICCIFVTRKCDKNKIWIFTTLTMYFGVCQNYKIVDIFLQNLNKSLRVQLKGTKMHVAAWSCLVPYAAELARHIFQQA